MGWYTKNEDLNIDEIPKSLEEGGVDFAYTFNGYKFGDSIQECTKASKRVLDAIEVDKTEGLTLSEIRTCLFLHFRAARHTVEAPSKLLVDTLLYLIRERVSEKNWSKKLVCVFTEFLKQLLCALASLRAFLTPFAAISQK